MTKRKTKAVWRRFEGTARETCRRCEHELDPPAHGGDGFTCQGAGFGKEIFHRCIQRREI